MRRQHQIIPNPRTANDALAVTDGAVTIGYIIERDSAFFAFDADGVLIGEYATRTQAVRSIRWCGELVPPTGPRAPAGAQWMSERAAAVSARPAGARHCRLDAGLLARAIPIAAVENCVLKEHDRLMFRQTA